MNVIVLICVIVIVVLVELMFYDVLIDYIELGVGWVNEIVIIVEIDIFQIDCIIILLYELLVLFKVLQCLLDDSVFDIEGWFVLCILDKFVCFEVGVFVNGDGVDKLIGFLIYLIVDNDVWIWGNFGYVVMGLNIGIVDGDLIIELVYLLGVEYCVNVLFVMNFKIVGLVCKLKDVDGCFLWFDGLVQGELVCLMGYSVLIVEDMLDVGIDVMVIVFGDFVNGYIIVECFDLCVLCDLFLVKLYVLFYVIKCVGGVVSDFNVIKLLKFGIV